MCGIILFMYISICVYVFILALFFWGVKIAPKKQFNSDYLSLDAMTCLKGFMALLVIFHHVSQKKAFQDAHVMWIFENIGFLFVGIFFFTSGYGLYKSYKTKPDYLNGFVKKRVLPIVISYYIMVCIYAVFKLANGIKMPLDRWICEITGLTMINSMAWFVYVIVILYLAFNFAFKHFKNTGALLFILFVILGQAALFIVMGHNMWFVGPKDWWRNPALVWNNPVWWKRVQSVLFSGEWWVNSTLCFLLGIIICQNEEKFTAFLKCKYGLKLVLTILLFVLMLIANFAVTFSPFSYWAAVGKDAILNNLVCYPVQSLCAMVFCLLVCAVMLKIYAANGFLRFCGKRSLEIYLMQELCIFSWVFLIEKNYKPIFKPHLWNMALFLVAVAASVLVSATIYHWLNQKATKFLKARNK